MPKKRKDKELQPHLECLPPLPDFDTDPDGNLDAYFYRIGALGSGNDNVLASDDPVYALALFKKICNFDHEPTLGELEALAAGREWKPISDIIRSEIELSSKRHDSLMDSKRLEFEETKNPLFAWDAFSICKIKKKPIPDWVWSYLTSVSTKIMNSDAQPKDLPEILGFKDNRQLMNGGAQAFKQYRTLMVRMKAVAYVVNILRKQPEQTIEGACETAFELMKRRWNPQDDHRKSLYSAASIHDWYKQYQKQSGGKGGET